MIICPICKTQSNKVLHNDNFPLHLPPSDIKLNSNHNYLQTLSVYQCKKCDFLFNSPQEENFYINLYNNQKEYVAPKNHNHWLNIIKDNNYENILDIGGGANSIFQLEEINSKITIVDYKVNPVYKLNRDLLYYEGGIEDYLNQNKNINYQAIFLSHLLEHISDPKIYIHKLINNKNLNRADFLIEIPNIEYYSRKTPYYTFFFEHCSLLRPTNLYDIFKEFNYVLSYIDFNTESSIMLQFKHVSKAIEVKKFYSMNTSEIINQYKSNIEKVISNFTNKTGLNEGKEINLLKSGGGSSNLFIYYLNQFDNRLKEFINLVDHYRKGNYMISINKLINSKPRSNLNSYILNPESKHGFEQVK